jgi:hypothetical protein
MEDISYFSFPQNKNIFTIPIDVNYRNNYILNYSLMEQNNSSYLNLDNINEIMSEKVSYDVHQNFSFSRTMLKKNWKNKVKKFLGKSIFRYKKLILVVEKKRRNVKEV